MAKVPTRVETEAARSAWKVVRSTARVQMALIELTELLEAQRLTPENFTATVRQLRADVTVINEWVRHLETRTGDRPGWL